MCLKSTSVDQLTFGGPFSDLPGSACVRKFSITSPRGACVSPELPCCKRGNFNMCVCEKQTEKNAGRCKSGNSGHLFPQFRTPVARLVAARIPRNILEVSTRPCIACASFLTGKPHHAQPKRTSLASELCLFQKLQNISIFSRDGVRVDTEYALISHVQADKE